MKSRNIKQQFVELRARGLSFDRIARELKVSKQSLIDWSRELQDEIATLKALELEALYESYFLTKENRVRSLGGMLTRMREEIAQRDLSLIPTEKLIELYLKMDSLVKDEATEPIFKTSQELEDNREDRALLDELTTLQDKPMRKLKAV